MTQKKQASENTASKETVREPLVRKSMRAASGEAVPDRPPVFEQQIEVARRIMKRRRNALREPAK